MQVDRAPHIGYDSGMKKPTLLIMAAGMGSRFGGFKQMEPMGAHGEALLDFSVFDAMRSGFGKAVFVIRHDFEKDFTDTIFARISRHFPCELAFQEKDSLVPAGADISGREKPWGTAHAIACAEHSIDAPFAVINADDFYGLGALRAMGEHLSGETDEGAIMPYELGRVLSTEGTVTRGLCKIENGFLSDIEEMFKIKDGGGKIISETEGGAERVLPADSPMSMNCFGFPARAAKLFGEYWARFFAANNAEPKKECLLPSAVMEFIKTGALRLRALSADSEWFGITYKEDRESAIRRIAEMTAAGVYPENLWDV